MRLIDADEYARDMKVRQDAALKWCDDAKTRCDYVDYALAETAVSIFCEAKLTLDKQPTVDAVPVVRCKDCRYQEHEQPGMVYCPAVVGGWVDNDWFCAGGERRVET